MYGETRSEALHELAASKKSVLIGVDIGGTFTDVVMLDEDDGRLRFSKVLTRYDDIVGNIAQAIDGILARADCDTSRVGRIVHGTTIATNTVVEEAGARMALITTAGFEDILEIGRLKRSRMYDLNIGRQTPVFLAPRRLRFGVPERISKAGDIIEPLNVQRVEKVFEQIKKLRVQSVAVAYLFSFVNPIHEEMTRDIAARIAPGLPISISSEIDPKYREYERTVSTSFDAYLRPKVEDFLRQLQERVSTNGIDAKIQIMQSRGALTSIDVAAKQPIHLFLSGPAAGVVGAADVAVVCKEEDAIAIDIGGTSSDVALIRAGKPTISYSGEIAGFPVRIPMIDMSTIGAGGGSIVWADGAGGLRVGPKSAGSEPGPACYPRGGRLPTITDASLVLGYLNAAGFAGGVFELNVERAAGSFAELSERTGLSLNECALGAHRIVNFQMAEQIRLMTLKRGLDPRRFSLVAFGGGGPLHAGALMSILGLKKAIIPPLPGVLSAYGLLSADAALDQMESCNISVDQLDPEELKERLRRLSVSLGSKMNSQGFALSDLKFQSFAEMRFIGQSFELAIPIDWDVSSNSMRGSLAEAFYREYELLYGYCTRRAIEIIGLKMVATKAYGRPRTVRPVLGRGGAAEPQTRLAWFSGYDGPHTTLILERSALRPGDGASGPAIIEQRDATIILYPDQVAEVDAIGNLILSGRSASYVQ